MTFVILCRRPPPRSLIVRERKTKTFPSTAKRNAGNERYLFRPAANRDNVFRSYTTVNVGGRFSCSPIFGRRTEQFVECLSRIKPRNRRIQLGAMNLSGSQLTRPVHPRQDKRGPSTSTRPDQTTLRPQTPTGTTHPDGVVNRGERVFADFRLRVN